MIGAQTNTNKEILSNHRISLALYGILFIPAINNFLNSILQIGLNINFEFLTPVSYIFMALLSVLLLYKHVLRKRLYFCIVIFFLVGVAISYLLYPEIRTMIYGSPVDLVYSPVNKLFFFCIPSLIGAASLTNYSVFFSGMRVWGRITTALGICTYLFVNIYVGRNLQYMVYSYFMLLPICVCYEQWKVSKSRADFILAFIGTICIVLCGARGAIMSLIMYFLVGIIYSGNRKVTLNRLLTTLIFTVTGITIIWYYNELIDALIDLLNQFNIESRFISFLAEGALLEDSGRNLITDAVVLGLKNNPFGYGLYGDRYVIGNFGYGRFTYAHNIIEEMLCDFGVIGGSIIFILIIWRFCRMAIRCKDKREYGLVRTLMPYGFFQLLFSSSYLENVPFFILMGMTFLADWRKIGR